MMSVTRVLVSAVWAASMLLLQQQQPVDAANYTMCGLTSTVAFKTWTSSLTTDLPVFYPKTEAELASLVKSVAEVEGCKIRVVGTGGTTDGLVALKQDNAVIVNLADLQVNAKWNDVLFLNKARVRMSAGKTLLDLMALVRPKGFLLESRSFGRYFTLGGFFLSPSTHGSTIESDRVAKQVSAVRVLLSNGKYVDITEKSQVNAFRGSLGLLGIVVGTYKRTILNSGWSKKKHPVFSFCAYGIYR